MKHSVSQEYKVFCIPENTRYDSEMLSLISDFQEEIRLSRIKFNRETQQYVDQNCPLGNYNVIADFMKNNPYKMVKEEANLQWEKAI